MGDLILLLRFDAPLQSWGIAAKGTVKTTEREPTLSGMVGLIANAMGRDRSDGVGDLAALTMGSRTDRRGSLVKDFYSAGTTTGIGTRVESRDADGRRSFKDTVSKDCVIGFKHYLSGAHFTVALSGEADVIEAAAAALNRPARALYLGRRSCPMNSDPVLSLVEGSDIETVLRGAPLATDLVPDERPSAFGESGSLWVANKGWCADERLRLLLPASPDHPSARMRYDVPLDFSDPHRRYGVRHVRHDYVLREHLTPQEVVA